MERKLNNIYDNQVAMGIRARCSIIVTDDIRTRQAGCQGAACRYCVASYDSFLIPALADLVLIWRLYAEEVT